ncbi:MAG TPA: hypothetical protein VJM50_18230 [Pyrinomonadaceae bacterium]|nr:hypothetical protein [Pyrinomonadaceae bacterium]
MADGIVYLTADFTAAPGTQTTATVERALSSTGPWTLLDTVDLLGEIGSYYDTSAPLDVNLWYRWTGDNGGFTIVQGPYIEPGDGTVLLKDPLRPWANLSLTFCESAEQAVSELCTPLGPEIVWVGFGEFTRRSDANLFDVYNSPVPADIYGRRKRLDGEMRLLTKSITSRDAVETLFTAGGPLQLQMPSIYGWPDAFVQPGDLTEEYVTRDQRKPIRLWTAPFTVVDRPVGPQQGTVLANWCALAETYPTYADLTASGFTWADVASGAATGTGPEFDGFGEGGFGEGPYGDGG